MTEETPEFPTKECPMCAGSGKVRDYKLAPLAGAAATYFVIDPEKLKDYDFTAMYGT